MRKFIGDKAFYKSVLVLVIPIMIQQGITSFVNLLDNIMVGALGLESISAVSISNQILFVFQLAIFGGLSAISIFGAQFYGKGDEDGLRYSFRAKIIFSVFTCIITAAVLLLAGEFFIALFLKGEAGSGDPVLTAEQAFGYMKIMLIGFVPFTISQAYASSLRETGETFMPMAASVTAILTNLLFNWLLIYGNLGFPRWGVYGAAVATALSRFLEIAILIIYTHRNTVKYPFVRRLYRSLYIPLDLFKRMILTGIPLLVNEVLWAFGMTLITQSYSTRGLAVVAAANIASTVWMLFMIFMIAMGDAVHILVGRYLGMGDIKKARDIDNKLIFMNLIMNIGLGIVLFACAHSIPLLYNVDSGVRDLAAAMLMIDGLVLPIESMVHIIYFTIRSGGKTFVTFLFDSVYTMIVPVQLAFWLTRTASLDIITIFLIVQFSAVLKMIIGIMMLRNDFWAKKIV